MGLRSAGQLRRLGEVLSGGALLLDVRTGLEYGIAHLPGAVHVPLRKLWFQGRTLPDPTQPIVVYCASGTRSLLAAFILRRLGCTAVHDLGPMRNLSRVTIPDKTPIAVPQDAPSQDAQ